jgi:hypothetical protein
MLDPTTWRWNLPKQYTTCDAPTPEPTSRTLSRDNGRTWQRIGLFPSPREADTPYSQHSFFSQFSSSTGSENIHGQVGGIVPPHGPSQMLSLETTGAKLSLTHHHQSLDTSRRPDGSSLPTHQEESAGTPSRIPASASRCVVSSIAHATAPFVKIATAPILDRA